ncbi:hypothetical protein MRX96_030199 [Rhipicephalus microplus]
MRGCGRGSVQRRPHREGGVMLSCEFTREAVTLRKLEACLYENIDLYLVNDSETASARPGEIAEYMMASLAKFGIFTAYRVANRKARNRSSGGDI